MEYLLTTTGNHLRLENAPGTLAFWGNYMAIETEDRVEAFPNGHFVENPVALHSNGSVRQGYEAAPQWVLSRFVRALGHPPVQNVSYEVIHKRDIQGQVVLLNCLDACYGHCLYKLANVLEMEKKDSRSLVVIVPPAFVHLTPDSVAEIWVVKTDFVHYDLRLQGFHEFVIKQIQRLGSVLLGVAVISLALESLDFTRMTRVQPFAAEMLRQPPFRILFVLRDDRFWLGSSFDYFIYMVSLKLRVTSRLRAYFVFRQGRIIRRFVKALQKQMDVSVAAIGIGKASGMPFLHDLRMEYDEFVKHEARWLHEAARAHISIGVHGSNLLWPSYLSGGCISLLPDFKIVNFSEDLIPKAVPAHSALYSLRILPLLSSPLTVATHAATMLEGWLREYKSGERSKKS